MSKKYGLYQLESGYDECTVNVSVVITEDEYNELIKHKFSYNASVPVCAYENIIKVEYKDGNFTYESEDN